MFITLTIGITFSLAVIQLLVTLIPFIHWGLTDGCFLDDSVNISFIFLVPEFEVPKCSYILFRFYNCLTNFRIWNFSNSKGQEFDELSKRINGQLLSLGFIISTNRQRCLFIFNALSSSFFFFLFFFFHRI